MADVKAQELKRLMLDYLKKGFTEADLTRLLSEALEAKPSAVDIKSSMLDLLRSGYKKADLMKLVAQCATQKGDPNGTTQAHSTGGEESGMAGDSDDEKKRSQKQLSVSDIFGPVPEW